jgi:undecaprenyl-diphosphatase
VTFLEALILGLVQGLTEFLPISSDGHLALAQHLLGTVQPLWVDVSVHVATLAAIIVAFRVPIQALVRGVLTGQRRALQDLGLYAVASAPAAVIGMVFKEQLEQVKHSLWAVGGLFVVMGLVLWTAKGRMAGTRERPNAWEAFAIGCGQAAAILPSISRSGSTITIALWRGIGPDRAADFSFVLGIPAIAGAAALEFPAFLRGVAGVGAVPVAVAMAAAFLSGLAAIMLLRRMLRARVFHRFAPYLWVVGLLTLALAAARAG